MLRRDVGILRFANQIADFAAFSLSFFAAFGVLFLLKLENLSAPGAQKDFQLVFMFYMLLQWITLLSSPIYPTKRLRTFSTTLWLYFKSVGFATILLIAVCALFAIRGQNKLIFFAGGLAFVFLLIKEKILKQILLFFRRSGRNLRNVIFVGGSAASANRLLNEIEKNPLMGLSVKGWIRIEGDNLNEAVPNLPLAGSLQSLPETLNAGSIDCVMFLTSGETKEEVKDAILQCSDRGLEVLVKHDFLKKGIQKIDLEDINGMPFINFYSGPSHIPSLLLKKIADRVVSAILLLLLSPIFLLVALSIKLTSPGPIIFKQYRIGKNGRKFVFFKFRSMVNNAEQLRATLIKKNEMKGPVFKIKEDPRITKIGKFLRKTSLDELPQIWNVFIGDMSFVGPRPPLPSEVQQYTDWQRRRLSIKPGITCIWQVEGRNSVLNFSDWAKMDLDYIDRWSIWLDLKLFLKTIFVVLQGTGK